MKVNLDPILEHQMKCESLKACKKVNETQSLKISQIVFIGPNYYVKHKCVKSNLDSILKAQLKCESMKECKNTQAKHMRCSF